MVHFRRKEESPKTGRRRWSGLTLLLFLEPCSVLAHGEEVYGHLLGFTMNHKLESFRHQTLEHSPHLILIDTSFSYRLQLESIGIEPTRSSRELIESRMISL